MMFLNFFLIFFGDEFSHQDTDLIFHVLALDTNYSVMPKNIVSPDDCMTRKIISNYSTTA